jgi:hypothetical protein
MWEWWLDKLRFFGRFPRNHPSSGLRADAASAFLISLASAMEHTTNKREQITGYSAIAIPDHFSIELFVSVTLTATTIPAKMTQTQTVAAMHNIQSTKIAR